MILSPKGLFRNRRNAQIRARLDQIVSGIRPLSQEILPSKSFLDRTREGLLQLFAPTSLAEYRMQNGQPEEAESSDRIVA